MNGILKLLNKIHESQVISLAVSNKLRRLIFIFLGLHVCEELKRHAGNSSDLFCSSKWFLVFLGCCQGFWIAGGVYGSDLSSTISGGSRFTRRGGANPPEGDINIRFCQIFPKTAWNWKNLDPRRGVGVSLARPPLYLQMTIRQSDIKVLLHSLSSPEYDIMNHFMNNIVIVTS